MKNDRPADAELDAALRRLAESVVVPAPEPARERMLMAAFDAAPAEQSVSRLAPSRRSYWSMAALATAAALLIAIGLRPGSTGRHLLPSGAPPSHTAALSPARGVQSDIPGEFVIVPGAATLPPMESGTLVRMDLPVSVLPSLGVTPPATGRTAVKADVVVAQDGLPRAVRLVN